MLHAPSLCSGQEGQGLEALALSRKDAAQGQEGHGSRRLRSPCSKLAAVDAGMSQWCPASQEGQGRHPLGASGPSMADAPVARHLLQVPGQEGQLLFQPGVLEVLSGAVAAKIAASAAAGEHVAGVSPFIFNAAKSTMQGHPKGKGRKSRKEGLADRSEDARKKIIGKKRRPLSDARPTGSDLVVSFEKNSMDSFERMLYDDVNVSRECVQVEWKR